jgi:hypothetical protein
MVAVAAGVLCLILRLMATGPGAWDKGGVIQPGTILTVQPARPLTSRSARLGDVFQARVVSAQATDGGAVIPAGALVEGRCVAVRAGQGNAHPGYLRLALSGLEDVEGRFVPLETTTSSQLGNSIFEAGRSPGDTSPIEARGKTSRATSNDAVVTPESRLRFVLLKSAELAGRRSQTLTP